ncbi:MAG: TraA family conjugative transfer protein [Parvibaculum sp.]
MKKSVVSMIKRHRPTSEPLDGAGSSRARKVALVAVGLVAVTALVLVPDHAHAGADPTFDDVWTTLRDWAQGSLGKVLAGGFVMTGLAAGIVRQSLMSFATGVGGGVGVYVAPDVIEEIVQASLPVLAGSQVQIEAVARFAAGT